MRQSLLAAMLAFGILASAAAQTSPFVDEKTERLLVNELSGDRAFETLRITTQWHKPSASEGFFAVARHVMERAREAGLEDVKWIDQVASSTPWTGRSAEAWLVEGDGPDAKETKLASVAEVGTSLADYSRPAKVTAEIVDVGSGESAADYSGKDVRGKIVLAYGSPVTVMEQAVWKRGGAGILAWSSTRLNALADAPDQVAWQHVPEKDGPKGEKTTFAFVLSARDGKALSDRLRGEATRRIFATGGETSLPKLRARVVVDSVVASERKTAMVEGRLRGSDPTLPEIVLTAHLQESKFSANDDQSGVASILEIGRTLTRLVAEGRIPRPRRGIRFWWADEIYSEYRYFADHPGEVTKVLANLNQDMVGARQSTGGRVQHMTRTPWVRPSFLADVEESILEMVVAGNTGYLPAFQAQSIPPGVPFSKPIFSRLGTREPYHARAVPYFSNTDHMVFNDSWVGVPGTTLTNWPDEFIHSSADDVWQIDATQIERNAFIVAATALWLANAGEPEASRAASYVAGRALGRIGRDFTIGLARIASASPPRDEDYRAAANLLATSLEKEIAAVRSVVALAPVTEESLRPRVAALEQSAREMQALLVSTFQELSGGRAPGGSAGTVEQRLAGRVPKRGVSTLAEWLELQEKVRDKRTVEERAKREARDAATLAPAGRRKGASPAPPPAEEPKLTSLMQFAAMNWIDGKRDAAEIARRVQAEALSAGTWYYGEVTPELVEKFFERQARDGLIRW
jgi:peptidase M28-like protein